MTTDHMLLEDAWREGARFALEAVSKVDSICWLTDSMRLACLKLATEMIITERDRRAARGTTPTAWKDHDTAALVNDLRECAAIYGQTQQLRERLASIVRPLCDRLVTATKLADDVPALDQALRTIAEYPATDLLTNMDAANMRRIAEQALAAMSTAIQPAPREQTND